MRQCNNCGNETMYEVEEGYRCAKCGWRWEFPLGVSDGIPTKSANADCGDVIANLTPGVDKAIYQKRMCNDGTMCSIRPSGLNQVTDNLWVVVCTHHK